MDVEEGTDCLRLQSFKGLGPPGTGTTGSQ